MLHVLLAPTHRPQLSQLWTGRHVLHDSALKAHRLHSVLASSTCTMPTKWLHGAWPLFVSFCIVHVQVLHLGCGGLNLGIQCGSTTFQDQLKLPLQLLFLCVRFVAALLLISR